MDTQEIIRILIEEKNYDAVQTQRLEAKIDALPEDIRTAFEAWVQNGTIDGPEYGGYTASTILESKPQFTVLNAYLTLDWLRRDEQAAKKALARPYVVFKPQV